MKVLVFHIGADRYALPLAAVARVLPVAGLTQVPQAPACVAGLLDLHGVPVPVIDLSTLAGMPPAQIRFDTRIILVDYAVAGRTETLGLQAESVAGVESVDAAALRASGIDGAPFLGRVSAGAGGLLQLVDIDRLLGPEVQRLLFRHEAAA